MINKFVKRFTNIPQELWLKISELESLRGKWVGSVTLHPVILGRLKRSVLITSTGASTRIEGSSLSDEDVEKLLHGLTIETFGNRDEQEVRGYYELLSTVFDNWESLKFNESLIKHFHQELLKYVDKDSLHRGSYKHKENAVGIVQNGITKLVFSTTRAYLTPKEMNELVEWTTKALNDKSHHPLLVIGNFVVEFLKIHPFEDGNGRLSRILSNLLLLQAGYVYFPYISHEKIIEDNKASYYLALRTTQKTFSTKSPNLTVWLNFFLDTLLTQSRMAITLFEDENIESVLSPAQLKAWQYIETVESTSPLEIAKQTGIPRPTINQILNKLQTLGRIERLGNGSATRYRRLTKS